MSKFNPKLCCVCCNNEDIVSTEQIIEKISCGGRKPLPICKYCLEQNITPPMINNRTNFLAEAKEDKMKRKRQLDKVGVQRYHKGKARKK